jgi:hypothetical protein
MVIRPPHQPPRRLSWGNAALLAIGLATCAKVWMPSAKLVEPAHGQLPNPAVARQELVRIGARTNELLTDIKRILESQTLHVTLEPADNQADSDGPARRGGK